MDFTKQVAVMLAMKPDASLGNSLVERLWNSKKLGTLPGAGPGKPLRLGNHWIGSLGANQGVGKAWIGTEPIGPLPGPLVRICPIIRIEKFEPGPD